MNLLPVIGIGLLALACPLMMVGMGVGAWVVARARGQKKDFSVGCMPMAHEQQHDEPAETTEGSSLHREVARLEHEIATLRAREVARAKGDSSLTAQNGGRNASEVR